MKSMMRHLCFVVVSMVMIVAPVIAADSAADGKKRDLEFAHRLFKDKLYELSARQFKQFALNYPDHPEAQTAALRVGEAYYLDAKYALAVEHLKAFIVDYPKYDAVDELWFKIGEAYRLSGVSDLAAEAYWHIRTDYAKSRLVTRAVLYAGRAYAQAQDHAAVIRVLPLLIEEFPKSDLVPEARLLIAQAAIALEDTDLALQHLEVVVSQHTQARVYAQARFVRASLLAQLGRQAEAARALQKIVKAYPKSDFFQTAVALTGELLFKEKMFTDAAAFLTQHLGSFATKDRGAVVLRLAQSYQKSNHLQEARIRYTELLDSTYGSALRPQSRYGLAGTYLAGGYFLESTTEIRTLLKEYPDAPLVRDARLMLALLYEKQHLVVDAADAYVDFLSAYQTKEEEFVALVRKAAVLYEQKPGNQRRVVQVYRLLLQRYPLHPFADEARFILAMQLEHLQEYGKALEEYKKLSVKYGEVGIGHTAGVRQRYIEEFKVTSYNDAVGEMFDLVGAMVGQHGDPRYRFKLGKVYFGRLREYTKALDAFNAFLQIAPDSARASEALYLTGECSYRLARKAELEGDTVMVRAYRDSLGKIRGVMVEKYATSMWSDDIELLVLEDELSRVPERTAEVLEHMLTRYREFLDRYRESDLLDRVLLNIGATYLHKYQLLQDDTVLLESALAFFDRLIENFPQSSFIPDAYYYRALALYRGGDYVGARDAFDVVVREYPQYTLLANALYYQAECMYVLQDFGASIELFRSIIYNYPSSPFMVEVKTKAGLAYAHLGNAEKSLVLLADVKDLVAEKGVVLLTMAHNYQTLGVSIKALAMYDAYLESVPDAADSVRLIVAKMYLASESAGKAIPYLEAVLKGNGESGVTDKARMLLSNLYFDRDNYTRALTLYSNIAGAESGGAVRQKALIRSAVCRYRLNDLTGARQEIEVFRKLFKKVKAPLARFKKEEADYFVRKKNYDRALQTYQKIVDEYEQSAWLDDALFGVANVLFITKKYEKALHAIDVFVEKYPKGALAADAYFKAGTIHFSAGEHLDAARFYRRALAVEAPASITENAAFNLVLVYEKMEKYDTAIAAARTFLERFPESQHRDRIRIKEAIFLMAWDKSEEALERFKIMRAQVAEPEFKTEISFWIGECLFALGRYEVAIEEYLRIVYFGFGLQMWKVTAEYKAGMAYEKLGKTDEAKKIYKYMTVHHGIATEWGRAAAQRLKVLED